MKKIFTLILIGFFVVGFSKPVSSAEPNGPSSFGFSMNFPTGVGATSDVLKNGLGFGFDYTYRPETSPLGMRFDMIYENFDLSSKVLSQINRADSGYATVWGFDGSVVLTPRHAGAIRPYIQGGPGFYYEYAQASRFTGGGGYVCDPWFGCWPTSTSDTLVDWSTWRMGWVGGAGLNIEFDGGGALYLQAQYHQINNSRADTTFVPISLGYRCTF